jgi:hypothetical protein
MVPTVPGRVSLVGADGQTRALVIPFKKMHGGDNAQHWSLLCTVANALQTRLELPAPAVSISGIDGYGLWLSLATPVPVALAQQFLGLLGQAYFPDLVLAPEAASAPVELPPCQNPASGLWAAFIHPDLGASFADESGLEMAPPAAGQAALLDGLHSISHQQFVHALSLLQPAHAALPAPSAATPPGLLLKDATLEDIIKHLHSKDIEPTFRHVIR